MHGSHQKNYQYGLNSLHAHNNLDTNIKRSTWEDCYPFLWIKRIKEKKRTKESLYRRENLRGFSMTASSVEHSWNTSQTADMTTSSPSFKNLRTPPCSNLTSLEPATDISSKEPRLPKLCSWNPPLVHHVFCATTVNTSRNMTWFFH